MDSQILHLQKVLKTVGVETAMTLKNISEIIDDLRKESNLIFSESNEIIELHLTEKSLRGKISESIVLLGSLEKLNLFSNFIHGSIPVQTVSLVNLVELDLSENQLTGPIPESLGTLTSLKSLLLFDNELVSLTLPYPCICIPLILKLTFYA